MRGVASVYFFVSIESTFYWLIMMAVMWPITQATYSCIVSTLRSVKSYFKTFYRLQSLWEKCKTICRVFLFRIEIRQLQYHEKNGHIQSLAGTRLKCWNKAIHMRYTQQLQVRVFIAAWIYQLLFWGVRGTTAVTIMTTKISGTNDARGDAIWRRWENASTHENVVEHLSDGNICVLSVECWVCA